MRQGDLSGEARGEWRTLLGPEGVSADLDGTSAYLMMSPPHDLLRLTR